MEPKPTYKVNPAVLPLAPEFMAAINKTSILIQDALSTIAPLSGRDTIMVSYHDWDDKCNTLAAIKENIIEWKNPQTPQNAYSFAEILDKISDLLTKAGY